nr:unnamed protein product [Callosobruchus analis]
MSSEAQLLRKITTVCTRAVCWEVALLKEIPNEKLTDACADDCWCPSSFLVGSSSAPSEPPNATCADAAAAASSAAVASLAPTFRDIGGRPRRQIVRRRRAEERNNGDVLTSCYQQQTQDGMHTHSITQRHKHLNCWQNAPQGAESYHHGRLGPMACGILVQTQTTPSRSQRRRATHATVAGRAREPAKEKRLLADCCCTASGAGLLLQQPTTANRWSRWRTATRRRRNFFGFFGIVGNKQYFGPRKKRSIAAVEGVVQVKGGDVGSREKTWRAHQMGGAAIGCRT